MRWVFCYERWGTLYLSYIWDNGELELVAEGAELFLDMRGFALAADGCSDGEACLEERLQCPCADEPVGSGDEDLSSGDCWHVERDGDAGLWMSWSLDGCADYYCAAAPSYIAFCRQRCGRQQSSRSGLSGTRLLRRNPRRGSLQRLRSRIRSESASGT